MAVATAATLERLEEFRDFVLRELEGWDQHESVIPASAKWMTETDDIDGNLATMPLFSPWEHWNRVLAIANHAIKCHKQNQKVSER